MSIYHAPVHKSESNKKKVNSVIHAFLKYKSSREPPLKSSRKSSFKLVDDNNDSYFKVSGIDKDGFDTWIRKQDYFRGGDIRRGRYVLHFAVGTNEKLEDLRVVYLIVEDNVVNESTRYQFTAVPAHML